MSVKMRTIALSVALAAGTTLVTGLSAHADQRPATGRPAVASHPPVQGSTRIGAGTTVPGQGWAPYGDNGLYIDVDTSTGHFTSTPVYTASVGGLSGQWTLTGTSTVYDPTPTGFRIYVRQHAGGPLTTFTAQSSKWYVNWIGIENP
ncbi:hypothetical protein [Sphaerisporangium perillae]|uniref:hypothetical protein n=1 Tax=Sphaerisporangium perillae TaxID=2935860 RepID=UPI00200C95CE|nr:hypothetical protein [Sphaerisporangium perillae]